MKARRPKTKVDVAKIRYEVTTEYPIKYSSVTIIARWKGRRVGKLELCPTPRNSIFTHYPGWVWVPVSLQRQGIALQMYLFAEDCLRLRLDQGDVNERSGPLWCKLQYVQGHASPEMMEELANAKKG